MKKVDEYKELTFRIYSKQSSRFKRPHIEVDMSPPSKSLLKFLLNTEFTPEVKLKKAFYLKILKAFRHGFEQSSCIQSLDYKLKNNFARKNPRMLIHNVTTMTKYIKWASIGDDYHIVGQSNYQLKLAKVFTE